MFESIRQKIIKVMSMGKKGVTAIANKVIYGFIGIVVILSLARYMLPEVVHAGNNISGLGLPFASLFSGTGLLILIVMVGLLIGVIGLVSFGKGKK